MSLSNHLPVEPPLTPRYYQGKAVKSLFTYWSINPRGNPLIIAPVAAGKSLIMAEAIGQIKAQVPTARVIMLCDVAELIEQDGKAFNRQYPDEPFCYYSASLGEKKLNRDVIFAGIQSVYDKAYLFGHIDFIFIDEAHMVSPKSETQFMKFISDLKTVNPKLKVAGLTGTPWRPETGWLHYGSKTLFTDIAYDIPIKLLIDEGYLCPPVTPDREMMTQMDTSGVGMFNGDFKQDELQEAVDKDELTAGCVKEIYQYGISDNRKRWMIFCAGVKHAEHVRDAMRLMGIPTEMITGKTPKSKRNNERGRIIDWLKEDNPEPRCIVNVATLTKGFDCPSIDLVAFMRPTRSAVLYVQCVGRGMRLHKWKKNCLVLDFGGVISALGPIDEISIKPPPESSGGGDAPIKQCPTCFEPLHAAAMVCTECGHVFERDSPIKAKRASARKILSQPLGGDWLEVDDVRYEYEDNTYGRGPVMKVTYTCYGDEYHENVCFQHSGRPRAHAVHWWSSRLPGETVPELTRRALDRARDFPMPSEIFVFRDAKKGLLVKGAKFDEANKTAA